MTMRTLGVSLALTVMLVSPVLAQVEEGLVSVSVGSGARALGMGGAFIAVADDATASSWNPAGLCVLEKAEASVVYQPSASYRNSYSAVTTETRSPVLTATARTDAFSRTDRSRSLDFGSVTVPLRLGQLKLVPQVSYQRVVDLGLDGSQERRSLTTYSAGSATTVAVDQDHIDSKGGIDVVAASLGLSFTQKLSLGVAVNLWRNGVDRTRTYRQQIVTTDSSGATRSTHNRDIDLHDRYSGKNVTLGLLVKPNRWLRLGAVYKTSLTVDLESTAHRVVVRTADGVAASTVDADVVKTGPIAWPRTIGAGLAVQPTDALTVSADVTHSAWSEASIDQTTAATNRVTGSASVVEAVATWPLYRNPAAAESATNPRQADTLQARLGVEYVVLRPGFAGLTGMPLRFGVFRDRQVTKDTPDLGDVYHLGLTGGLGFVWSRLSLDFAYVHTRGDSKCCEYETTDASGNTVRQTQDGTDAYRTHRVFVSSTVRF
jgi:long-subunit fatty acid transport protein